MQHEDGLFPPYFSTLFCFLADFVLPPFTSSDAKVRHICESYGVLLQDTCGIADPVGEEYFKRRAAAIEVSVEPPEGSGPRYA